SLRIIKKLRKAWLLGDRNELPDKEPCKPSAHQYSGSSSPPSRVISAATSPTEMLLFKKTTEPSARAAWTPPGCSEKGSESLVPLMAKVRWAFVAEVVSVIPVVGSQPSNALQLR